MPVPRTLSELVSDLVYEGLSINTWKVSVRDVTDHTVAGYLINVTGYTSGTALSNEAIELYFEDNGSTLDIIAGEVLHIDHDLGLTTVRLPAVTVNGTLLFVDTNGVCFTDVALTTPADTITNITNESLTATEASVEQAFGESAETLTIAETVIAGGDGSTQETITITEESTEILDGTSEDAITIAEANEEPIEGESADTVSIVEDNSEPFLFTDDDIWVDEYVYSLIEADATFMLVTGVKDMGYRGLKFVGMIEVSLTDTQGASVSVFYRTNKASSWAQTSWTLLNRQGVAYVKAVGVEFKIALKCSDYRKIDTDKIVVRWKPIDKRFMRGPYADTNVP